MRVDVKQYSELRKQGLTIDDIDDILQLTGCTYEELFGMKNSAKGINNANHKRNK